jgi:predicted small metal-binding protein
MKTMTCREMGGKCDAEIKADSSSEMAKKMTAHVMEKHPDVFEKMKNMTESEHKKWEEDFHKNWASAAWPETKRPNQALQPTARIALFFLCPA